MYASNRQFPVAKIATVLGLLYVVAGSAAIAGPVPLGFDDGNGTSQVDQYQGTAGDGWSTAWGANTYDPSGGPTGSLTGDVVSTSPLAGGGNYLSTAITNCRGMVNRGYGALDGSFDATQPHTIQFKYRLDSMTPGFSTGGRPVVIADSNVLTSSTHGGNTWYAQVSGAGGNWLAYSGDTGVPLTVGTVYDVTVMVRPADNSYDLYVSGGGNSGVVLGSSFRRTDGDVGRYLHFGNDTNGATGGIDGNGTEFSLDAVKLLPAAKVWNNSGTGTGSGSWTYNDGNINWSGTAVPTATDDAAINNGGEASIRSTGTAEVRTLYLGATAGGSGGIHWDRDNPIDLHVYQDLVVGEEGTGTARMTNNFTGHTATVDVNLYIGRRSGSTGTVTQDRGSVLVGDNLLMGVEGGSNGTYDLQGGDLTVRNLVGDKSQSVIGSYGTAVFNHTGGTFAVAYNDLLIGDRSTGHGTYNLSGAGSSLTGNDDLEIGRSGTGVFNQNGGSVNVRDGFSVGIGSSGHGEYNLAAGTFLARNANNLNAPTIGSSGTGLFNQTGGSATFQTSQGQDFYLGRNASGDGTYTISDGSLDVQMTMFVGDSGTGRFHIIGDDATIEVDGYSQNALSTLELDINGISPINVDGEISLDGTLDVEFLATPQLYDQFAIFLNDEADPVSGTFAGLSEGSLLHLPGFSGALVITYQANLDGGAVGNDVMLTAVPEPSTFFLAGLALVGLLGVRGRRGRRSA